MTTVIHTFLAALLLALPVLAQPVEPAPPPPAAAIDLTPPGPLETMAAFKALEQWLRDWSVPDAAAVAGLERAGGCAVTLRLDSRTIARAASFDAGAAGLAGAARAALAEALPRLPIPQDVLARESARAIAPRITVSLELAGPLIPFTPVSFTEVDASLEPGLDGLAARVGERTAGTFPAAMLTMNLPPSDALAAAISQASGDPTLAVKGDPRGQPGALAQSHNARYFKFRVTHLAHLGEGQAPAFLFRSGQVVDPLSITRASMEAFASDLAGHLQRRVLRDGESRRVIGTLVPFQGRAESDATPLETLIAVRALARYAARAPGVDLAELHRLRAAVTPEAAASPIDAAAWVLASEALDALPHPDGAPAVDPATRARIGALVAGAHDPDTGWTTEVPAGARGFIAYALAVEARAAGLEGAEAEARTARARRAVTAVYVDTPPARLVAQMPWLGLAELLLSDGEIGAAPALLALREQVWKHQLTDDDAVDAPDLAGGIVFTSSANPLPTWQSVRPVLFLAAAARDPRLTTERELVPELSRLLGAVRFFRQLAVDDHTAHAAVEPEFAKGGVRSSLWDQRQPIEATSLTLLAVCEVLDTLDTASKPAQK